MGFARSARAWIEKHRLRNEIAKLLSNRDETNNHDSMQLRVCPSGSRSLEYVDKLSNEERKRNQGDSIRRGSWVMGPLNRLAILGLVHRFEADWLLLVDSGRNDGTFASPSPCKQSRLTTSPVRKYGSS